MVGLNFEGLEKLKERDKRVNGYPVHRTPATGELGNDNGDIGRGTRGPLERDNAEYGRCLKSRLPANPVGPRT